MTEKEHSSSTETTLTDVLKAVQVGFAGVENRLDTLEAEVVEVKDRLNGVESRLGGLERRTGSLEEAVADVKETVDGIARAVDKDAVTVLDHERRISHLEHVSV